MRKTLFAAVLALAGLAATTTPARAWWNSPTTTSATFPLLTPSGYYTNTYYYGWAYPWFAYYNYAHGPYAYSGGYATYGYGTRSAYADPFAGTGSATLVVTLPAEATLKFNGVASTSTGATRSFTVPALSYGQDYGYDLAAEVTANGKTAKATAKVVVRAGQTARVTIEVK